MDIMKYITENALILVPALYVIGVFLKGSEVKDKLIPWILLILGLGGSIALNGASVNSVIQGILVTGATVLGNQLYKQIQKEQ
jgi:hypothetical protein